MSRLLAWLLTAPILICGLVAGHELGYRLTVADPDARAHQLAETGHGYSRHAPYLAALVIALVMVALGLRMREAILGRRCASTRSFAFALLPPFGFVLLEAFERLSADELTLSSMTAPGVVTGLVLQLPFALAALLVVRLLGSFADAMGIVLRSVVPRLSYPSASGLLPSATDLPRTRVAALAYGERGPPFS
jgi:hypothetical protein